VCEVLNVLMGRVGFDPMGTNAPGSFEGFADGRATFFRKLAKNQNKEWFLAHKAEYEEGYAAPMLALVSEAREALDSAYPTFELGAPKVFRLHRDVRFSADKTPYKTHVGGVLVLGGAKVSHAMAAALYVQVGTETFAGAGTYGMDPPALARYRAALLDEDRGPRLAKKVLGLTKKGYTLGAKESLKKVPRGVPEDHPRADLLKQKGLVFLFPPLEPATLTTRALLRTLVRHGRVVAEAVAELAEIAEG